MATTKNHPITKTLKRAIDYCMGDKVEDILKEDLQDNVAYWIDDKTGKVIYPTLHSTWNCDRRHPYEKFMELIHTYGEDELKNGNPRSKDGEPILAWHYHQNFEGYVDPVIANEIGRRLAEEIFKDFSVVIGTHTNTENTHNHIIICAWDKHGHKWNQCNNAYRHIREVSDNLCEEYGLSVLHDTRKQKIVKWKDKNGQIHYYEPTKRKNEMLHKREEGEISTDDVGSYRNTIAYEQTINKDETNREIVKRDIDRILPVATSYEHLIQMLRQIGYTIKDKKKNGDWLKHISFQPPTADKATRDYKIGDGGFYLRENLERVIEEFNASRTTQKEQSVKQIKSQTSETKIPPYFNEYIYDKDTLININDDIRTVKDREGNFYTVERSETERAIIKNVRIKDGELRLIDTSKLEKLIYEQKEGKNISKEREEILLQQINESFHVLRFVEKESLYSQSQINIITAGIWEKYNECIKNLNKLEIVISHLDKVLQVPKKIETIEARMEQMKNNNDYIENEFDSDVEQLKIYQETIEKYKLNDSESIGKLAEQISHSKEKIEQLQRILAAHREKLMEYDRCVAVLNRIDSEYGRDNKAVIEEYKNICRQGEKEAKQTEEMRKKRKAAER